MNYDYYSSYDLSGRMKVEELKAMKERAKVVKEGSPSENVPSTKSSIPIVSIAIVAALGIGFLALRK